MGYGGKGMEEEEGEGKVGGRKTGWEKGGLNGERGRGRGERESRRVLVKEGGRVGELEGE